MNIRHAKDEDKTQILGLLDELIACALKMSGKPPKFVGDNVARGNVFAELMLRKDHTIFVAEEDGKVVGMAELFIIPILRRGYYQGVIETFVITESMRGKGVGSSLMRAVFDHCKKNNIKVLKLTSSVELPDAHRFYEKHGGKFTEKMFRFDL